MGHPCSRCLHHCCCVRFRLIHRNVGDSAGTYFVSECKCPLDSASLLLARVAILGRGFAAIGHSFENSHVTDPILWNLPVIISIHSSLPRRKINSWHKWRPNL